MIEMLPNWHPVFVHYTIALLSISALFYLAGVLLKNEKLITVARWNLWTGALITIGTLSAGLIASGSVAHDEASHAAMMNHRNWALGTAAVFIVLAVWSFLNRKKSYPPAIFLILILLATGALATTGYKGGELVYRHGTGVMSLPDTGAHDHSAHAHGGHEEQAQEPDNPPHQDDHSDHDHEH